MFGKLKEKLKSALSIFSKKAVEEADVKEIEVEREVPVVVKAAAKKVDVVPEKKVEPVSAKKVGKKEEKKTVAKKEEKIEKKEDKTVGKKSVLIFHGWEDTAESGFIPRLKQDLHERGYDAASFDQPNTEKPRFETWFSFAEKKIASAHKHDLCIVGHSMGGLLSLKLAEKYKLKKLILVAPVGVKPSADYFKSMGKKLKPQELEIFKQYQNRNLDIAKIKQNVPEIVFIFGLQDPWITQEVRDYYINSFKDVAEIHVFETYAHMSESEGVKELPILKELFVRDLKIGVVEHTVERKKAVSVTSTAPVKKNLLAQQMEHFAKLKEREMKKEEVKKKEELKKEEVVEKAKVIEEVESVKEDEAEEVDEETEEVSGGKDVEQIEGVQITYFVHGTTTDNEKDIATGWNPGELSLLGIRQSKECCTKLREKKFDVVFCSDLKRAVDSAELMFKGRDIPIFYDSRLREANYGDFNGKKAGLFKERMNEYVDTSFPNGESYRVVEQRIAEFVNFLYDNYSGKRVAIVAHQAPQLALDVLLKKKTWLDAIKEDWRLHKAFQLGWEYVITEAVEVPVLEQKNVEFVEGEKEKEESTGFFGKLKKTFMFKKEEQKIEDDFADVEVKDSDKAVVEKNVAPAKVEVKQPIILKKKVVVEDDSDEEEQEAKTEKKGLFGKIKETITSRTISEEKFEELFWDLELALLENNVSVEVIEKIKVDLKQELVNKPLPWDVGEKIHKTLTRTLTEILSFESQELGERIGAKKKKPYVIAFFGINGTGKTTSIAKLTYHLQEQGYAVVLAACDTFRAAAIQQLGEHAQKLNVKMIQHNYGSDAAAVAFDAVQYAEKNKIDVVLIDTAGRLHSNTNLMAELQKIIRVVKPDLKIFVGESITGNDCIEQAREFNNLVEMDGAILTKADVDEKGGAPLSIAYTIKKPILFLGVGQEYKDLEKFEAETILGRLGL